jgi:hypothetical protein
MDPHSHYLNGKCSDLFPLYTIYEGGSSLGSSVARFDTFPQALSVTPKAAMNQTQKVVVPSLLLNANTVIHEQISLLSPQDTKLTPIH